MEQVNKTALITGAAKGIGKAVALAFAKEGYNIVINYNGSKEAALNTQQEIEALGVKTLVVQADVSDEDQVKTMVEKSVETFERIDVLVNNSGINKDGLMEQKTPYQINTDLPLALPENHRKPRNKLR